MNCRRVEASEIRGNGVVKNCNCRNKLSCPLQNKCLTENLVYEARVSTVNKVFSYIGATAGPFKKRWANHIRSFKDQKLRYATSLANLIFGFNQKRIKWKVDWSIIGHRRAYRGGGVLRPLHRGGIFNIEE